MDALTHDERPQIDVVIPIYNVAPTIEQAINSVLAQSVESFRILVIDDGSTDGSADIVTAIAERDPRVVLLSKSNSGIVDALNLGLANATADFVARLDGDDLCDPDRFECQLRYMTDNPDCVAVSCNARLIDEAGDLLGAATDFGHVDDADPGYAPSKEPYLSHPFLFVRRATFTKLGGSRHAFHAEDVDLYWRLQHVGRIHGLKTVHGSYRVHQGSITSKSILNARIASVAAQLAAISEVRRRKGEADIAFPRDRIAAYQHAGVLSRIVTLASEELTQPERSYLEIASAAKLLEWAKHRPFEIDRQDCRFICGAIARNRAVISPANYHQIRKDQVAAVSRLVHQRLFSEAFALSDAAVFKSVVRSKLLSSGKLS